MSTNQPSQHESSAQDLEAIDAIIDQDLATSVLDAKENPRVVIITGLSGAGRRSVAHAMEDIGWFVVDNLPPSLLDDLIQTAKDAGQRQLAVGLDVRSRQMFDQLPMVFKKLAKKAIRPEICFLEATDETIIRRQESVRRPLPLQGNGSLIPAVVKERRMLSDLRASADIVIDTTDLTVHQLKARIGHIYGGKLDNLLRVQVMSFGFKNGLPLDADMVFDVRFLPNPFWVPSLRPKTGLSKEVSDYVLSQPGAPEFVDSLVKLIDIVESGYINEGKHSVTIAIGCTGGKHRSTALSEAFAQRMRERNTPVSVLHRDLGLE